MISPETKSSYSRPPQSLNDSLWRKQVQEVGNSHSIPFIYTILIQGDIRYTIFSGTDLAIRSVLQAKLQLVAPVYLLRVVPRTVHTSTQSYIAQQHGTDCSIREGPYIRELTNGLAPHHGPYGRFTPNTTSQNSHRFTKRQGLQ